MLRAFGQEIHRLRSTPFESLVAAPLLPAPPPCPSSLPLSSAAVTRKHPDRIAYFCSAPPLQLHPECTPLRITRGGAHGLILHYTLKGHPKERQLEVGVVMMATGRKPRTHALGLDAAGVAVDAEGAIR